MNKLIYFAPVLDDPADEFDSFEPKEGDKFDMLMEVHVEDKFIRIKDSIGRMLPVDVEQIESMIAALDLAKEIIEFKIPDVSYVYGTGFTTFDE